MAPLQEQIESRGNKMTAVRALSLLPILDTPSNRWDNEMRAENRTPSPEQINNPEASQRGNKMTAVRAFTMLPIL